MLTYPNYFDSIRNWDKEKNKRCCKCMGTAQDDPTGKFEFYKGRKAIPENPRPNDTESCDGAEQVTAPAVMIQAAALEETEEETVTRRLVLYLISTQKHTRVLPCRPLPGRRMRNRKIFEKKLKDRPTKFVNTEPFEGG